MFEQESLLERSDLVGLLLRVGTLLLDNDLFGLLLEFTLKVAFLSRFEHGSVAPTRAWVRL